ncbi:hypothetical protein [Clavibacter zhangzhiyongii]|uniref:hypothetical protein n=1 Tax=Clavibacter zhangzhiyongii TaxID=2768071 RepID=UPI0039E00C9A
MNKRSIMASATAVIALAVIPMTAAQAAESSPSVSETDFTDQIQEYANAHPADVDGLEGLDHEARR